MFKFRYLGYSCNYLQTVLHFRPTLSIKGTLMLRIVHIRNKKQSNKHGILQTWSIVFIAMLLNQQERSPRKYCYHLSVIWKLLLMKIISLKLGYLTVNTRNYVRCARSFYLFIFLVYFILDDNFWEKFISISSGFQMTDNKI